MPTRPPFRRLDRPTAHGRGYGKRWQKLRRMILNRDPVCTDCWRNPSTIADHIIPKRDGGPDALENLQGLCQTCHNRKTARGQ